MFSELLIERVFTIHSVDNGEIHFTFEVYPKTCDPQSCNDYGYTLEGLSEMWKRKNKKWNKRLRQRGLQPNSICVQVDGELDLDNEVLASKTGIPRENFITFI